MNLFEKKSSVEMYRKIFKFLKLYKWHFSLLKKNNTKKNMVDISTLLNAIIKKNLWFTIYLTLPITNFNRVFNCSAHVDSYIKSTTFPTFWVLIFFLNNIICLLLIAKEHSSWVEEISTESEIRQPYFELPKRPGISHKLMISIMME